MDWSPLARSALFERAGRGIALIGVALPLLLIGHSKFAAFEVEALKPLIAGTPWLAWMYAVLSPVEVSRLLGVVEIATALLLMASPWMPRAGTVGGALGVLTFCVTASILAALPIWEAGWGGFPALNGLGSFLIKDIALLGISLVVLGESAGRLCANSPGDVNAEVQDWLRQSDEEEMSCGRSSLHCRSRSMGSSKVRTRSSIGSTPGRTPLTS